jgi:hypothetical protein
MLAMIFNPQDPRIGHHVDCGRPYRLAYLRGTANTSLYVPFSYSEEFHGLKEPFF